MFSLENISILDYEKQYIKLSHAINRAEIIDQLTREPEEVYYLEKKYHSILNNIYSAYKPIYKNNYQAKKEEVKNYQPYYYILNNGEQLQPSKKEIKGKLIFRFLILPLHFIICLFYFATRPRKRKRR